MGLGKLAFGSVHASIRVEVLSLVILTIAFVALPRTAHAIPSFYQQFPSSMMPPPTEDRWRAAFLSSLQALEEMGVHEIGSSENPSRTLVNELRRRAKDVEYKTLSNFQKSEDARRWSAFNEPAHKRVYINAWLTLDDVSLRLLSLHETLEALGYQDRDYQLSLLMHLLPGIFAEEGREGFRVKRLLALLHSSFVFAPLPDPESDPDAILILSRSGGEGGGDAVGGGGDSDGLYFKRKLLERVIAGMKPGASWRPVQRVLDLEIDLLFSSGNLVGPPAPGYADLRFVRLNSKRLKLFLPRGLARPSGEEAERNSELVLQYLLYWLAAQT